MGERVNFAERVRFANEIGRLKEENAKLRQLVRNLYACINNRDCDYCEYADEACEFERNMSELGVDL